ncbi:hypothetical protein EL22_02795 [Halostagnicola sp. A56]|uniref:type II secretion system F family protein n=1 Tax=Halostagnicola sp. A56 TaxID=1495067 RepID=UPI00049ECE77|nr:type II secretion system F family protein [Halostagnicola sp. A56]KDE58735.1 hypothetical protein EL22_02795 [Halostagnicola sp. A56]
MSTGSTTATESERSSPDAPGPASPLARSSRLYALLVPVSRPLDRKLEQARMNRTGQGYLARALRFGSLVGFGCYLAGLILGYVVVGARQPSETIAIAGATSLVCGVGGGGFGVCSILAIPYARAAARKREIDALLPDAIAYMYALSVGGLDHLEVFEALADAEDAYGDVALAFRSVRREVEYAGVDYRTAIRTRARETPSDELAQFLLDLLSTINSGGDFEGFLAAKTDRHAKNARRRQERTLDTLELIGELYLTVSLFPLLVVVVVVVMQLVPGAATIDAVLYLAVYGLIPAIGVGFLVLISTVKRDDPGTGILERRSTARDESARERDRFGWHVVAPIGDQPRIRTRIARRAWLHRVRTAVRNPHRFLRDRPLATLAVTVPAAILAVMGSALIGASAFPSSGGIEDPTAVTIRYLYVPLCIVLTPLAIFHEWNRRRRRALTDTLSETLRTLSSANDTGQTLLESFRTVSRTASGTLATELDAIHTKVAYGRRLDESLFEFANGYRIPRLARTTRLIADAQKATNHITPVLRTAASASESHDDLEAERRSRTRVQIAIIVMTFVTMLTVIVLLQTQFVETMSALESGSTTGSAASATGQLASTGSSTTLDADTLSVVFFHAVTIHAILSGFVCGYLRNADLLSGAKYVLALSTVALCSWLVVV